MTNPEVLEFPTRSRPKRHYSDNEKANTLITLELNGFDANITARSTGIPRKTILEWHNGRVNKDVNIIRQHQKENLADRFEALAHSFIDQANNTIEHSKGHQAATGAAIATDKMRLLREQSTTITSQEVDPLAQVMRSVISQYNEQRLANNLPQLTEAEVIQHLNKAAEHNKVDAELLKAKVLQIDE